MRLFFADLLMMLGALLGLLAIPWTPYAPWGLAMGAAFATAGLALDWRNVPRRVAYFGCALIGWQAPGLLGSSVAYRVRPPPPRPYRRQRLNVC